MAFTIETKNSTAYSFEGENEPSLSPDIGSPIGLLLALTYAVDLTGYSTETKTSASFNFESKNNS